MMPNDQRDYLQPYCKVRKKMNDGFPAELFPLKFKWILTDEMETFIIFI